MSLTTERFVIVLGKPSIGVYVRGGDHDAEPTNDASGPLVTEPAKREITFHDLLTHTSVRKIAPQFLSQVSVTCAKCGCCILQLSWSFVSSGACMAGNILW